MTSMPTRVPNSPLAVIGGGPAGLAATRELARRGRRPVCYEADTVVGGLARTICRDGFRFDIGGHRFYSRSPRINRLWREVLGDEFLERQRLSRIVYRGRLFDYPLRPANALAGLGPVTAAAVVASYLYARLFPLPVEADFESWVTNRFGRRLYEIFLKGYTEKVWGMECRRIRAEWAAQRIQGLSLATALRQALFPKSTPPRTLVDRFHYPRLGPGQMYEAMAAQAEAMGARIRLASPVAAIIHDGRGRVTGIRLEGEGEVRPVAGCIATLPLPELVKRLEPQAPAAVLAAARALRFRALVTVNFMLAAPQRLPDTWIYVQEPEITIGRLQFFANWSPWMVPNPERTSSVGVEYFCTAGDELWSMADGALMDLARRELARLDLVDVRAIRDGFVVRMGRCYPVYDEGYNANLAVLRRYLQGFTNLQPCGRHGLFRYNNMDHSILTGLYAVDNLVDGTGHDLWQGDGGDVV